MNANQQTASTLPSQISTMRDFVIVFYRKLPHVMSNRVIHRAMRDRQIAGDFDSVAGLADQINASRSTVSRFFAGRNTSLTVTLRILVALNLTFDQVFLEISPTLLARLQADKLVCKHNGCMAISTDILTWPEANEMLKHFGLPVLMAGLIPPALTQ